MSRGCAGAGLLVVASFALLGLAWGDPTPGASDAADVAGCSGAQVEPTSLTEVYARDISDRPTLRFIALLEHVDHRAIGAYLRAVKAAPAASAAPVSDVGGNCLLASVPSATERAKVVAELRWDISDEDEAAIVPRFRAVFDALARRDALSPDAVDRALAPFGTTLAQLSAQPAAPGCASHDARVEGQPVELPMEPGMTAGAKVTVAVSIDDEGLVRRARLFDDTMERSDDRFIDSSLEAAGATAYVPEVDHCHATGGTYLFQMYFNRSEASPKPR